MTTPDPFDALAQPSEPQRPRPSFVRALRTRVASELGLDPATVPTIDLPERKSSMTTTTSDPASDRPAIVAGATITPYLTSADAAAAIEWYAAAFGAEDEHPALGVLSPRSLGGPSAAFHLDVPDVDALFARAVEAGATVLQEPADQPHGARHGTLLDPDGHRWMLSQQIEALSIDQYAARSEGSGYRVEAADGPYVDGIWAVVTYRDPDEGIRFLTEVLGFEEYVMVRDDAGTIRHSEYRWPEGASSNSPATTRTTRSSGHPANRASTSSPPTRGRCGSGAKRPAST